MRKSRSLMFMVRSSSGLQGVDHHPAVQQVQGARGLGRVRRRVGHDHHRRALGVNLAQQAHDFVAVGGVEVTGRFVGQQHGRDGHQRARDRHALLLAAGQLRGTVAGAVRHAQALQHLLHAAAALGGQRDRDALARLDLGVAALGTCPRKSRKNGDGETDRPVAFGGATIRPGDRVVVDEDGLVVTHE